MATVLSISANGATETLYISQSGSDLYYKRNSGSNTLIDKDIIDITNSNATPSSNILKVIFTTDITISSTNRYFRMKSDGIQFGSDSLNASNTRPVITISVASHEGVIENGTSGANGKSYISVYNLVVDGTGYTNASGAGWIGRGYYSKGGTNNYIINCSSKGNMANNAGGIVGYYSGTNSGNLTIIGCSSTGDIGATGNAGGIAGSNCDNVTCEQCFSEGPIRTSGGGIFGVSTSGNCSATKCYSIGAIGGGAGGIIGAVAASGISASKCYSRGDITNNGGGIFGSQAASTLGDVVTATNCYSSGSLLGLNSGGIYGNPFGGSGTRTSTNCYSANNSWSDSTANTNLTGTPSSSPDVGTAWASTTINTAYELTDFGATPYQAQTISGNALVQSYSQTKEAGQSSTAALSSSTFTILEKTGGSSASYDTITINATTGALSTTTATVAGTYTIYVRSTGSYYITTFVLTVTEYVAPPAATVETTCCKSTMDERGLSFEWINDYRIGNRLIAEHTQNPSMRFNGYSEYVKYKMAQASRKT